MENAIKLSAWPITVKFNQNHSIAIPRHRDFVGPFRFDCQEVRWLFGISQRKLVEIA